MILSKFLRGLSTGKVFVEGTSKTYSIGRAGNLLMEGASLFSKLKLDDSRQVYEDMTALAHVLKTVFSEEPFTKYAEARNESALEAVLYAMLALGDLQPMSQLRINHTSTPTLTFTSFSTILDICSVKDDTKRICIETKFSRSKYSAIDVLLRKGYAASILPKTDQIKELITETLDIEFEDGEEARQRKLFGADLVPLNENQHFMLLGAHLENENNGAQIYLDYLIDSFNVRKVEQTSCF